MRTWRRAIRRWPGSSSSCKAVDFFAIATCLLMLALLVADYLQTLTIVRDPKWRELNPLLSFELRQFPAQQEAVVAVYFAAVAALVVCLVWVGWAWAVAAVLPLQAWCVWHNWRIGIEMADWRRK